VWALAIAVGLALGVGALPGASPVNARDLPPFERIGSLTLDPGEDQLSSAVIDPAGDFAYVGTTAGVVKIDLAAFARVGVVPAPSPQAGVVDPAGKYAYFAMPFMVPGRVIKIDLDTFEKVDELTLELGESFFRAGVIDPTGRYAYFGTSGPRPLPGQPGYIARLVRVDLQTFERAGALAMPSYAYEIASAAVAPDGRYAYVGANTTGFPVVLRVDLDTFAGDDIAALSVSETSWAGPVAVDPTGAFAYFGTLGTSSNKLVKIDLDTFTQVDVRDPGGSVRSAVMDPAGSYAHIAVAGWLRRIDLAHLEQVDEIVLATGTRSFAAAVVDPAGEFAYFGDAIADPGLVVKVRVDRASATPAPDHRTWVLTTYGTTAGWDAHLVADVTGNRFADLVSYHPSRGRWWVTESLGEGRFAPPRLLTTYGTRTGWDAHLAADVTGNGFADLVSYHPSRGRWWVTESLGEGQFAPPRLLTTYATTSGWEAHLAADVTGNGFADLLSYHPSRGRWWVTESLGEGQFAAPRLLTTYGTRTGWEAHLAADMTGNGFVDLVSYHPTRGRWWVTESLGEGQFAPPRLLTIYATTSGWEAHLAADVTGNGFADLVSYHPSRGRWWVTESLGGGQFGPPTLLTTYATTSGWEAHLAADMTGTGAADLLSFQPSDGRWWITSDVNRPTG
jgi:DNA-binding beta-propeller fold protein YncE